MRIAWAVLVCVLMVGCVRHTPQPPQVNSVFEQIYHGPDGSVYIVGHTRIEYPVTTQSGIYKRHQSVQWLARCMEISPGKIGGKLNCKQVEVLGLPTEEIEEALYEAYKDELERRGLFKRSKAKTLSKESGDDR